MRLQTSMLLSYEASNLFVVPVVVVVVVVVVCVCAVVVIRGLEIRCCNCLLW